MIDAVEGFTGNVPTCVGVYRNCSFMDSRNAECPHVRGGVPLSVNDCSILQQMSPRAWGCTVSHHIILAEKGNVPTCVGVYRKNVLRKHTCRECPHVRGGVPVVSFEEFKEAKMSPRAWGCTVVVAPGESAFIECPHVRGGVPALCLRKIREGPMSPRAWGCTLDGFALVQVLGNVPTCVGVYHHGTHGCASSCQCPHVRGGVPVSRCFGQAVRGMSPRAWGCTSA